MNKLLEAQKIKTHNLHYLVDKEKHIGRTRDRANLLSKSNNETARKFLLNADELKEFGIKKNMSIFQKSNVFEILEVSLKYATLVDLVGVHHYLTYTTTNIKEPIKNVKKTTFMNRFSKIFRRSSKKIEPVFVPSNTIIDKLWSPNKDGKLSIAVKREARYAQLVPLFFWAHLPEIIDIVRDYLKGEEIWSKLAKITNDFDYFTGFYTTMSTDMNDDLSKIRSRLNSYLQKIYNLREEGNYSKYIYIANSLLERIVPYSGNSEQLTPKLIKEKIGSNLYKDLSSIIFFTEDMIEANNISKFMKVEFRGNVYYTTLDPKLIKKTIEKKPVVNINNINVRINNNNNKKE